MLRFLANELIFEILRHFLPGLKLSVDKPDIFPWYLGQICSTWRAVFISSPQFWSTLDIDVDAFLQEGHRPYHDSLFELVQVALKRSNSHPLSLDVNMYRVFDADDAILQMRANDILEMLVTRSVYWKDLRMTLHSSCYPTLYRAKDRLPILRSIKVIRTRYTHQIESDSINFQDLFTNATQLTHVYFAFTAYWRVNWSTVTVIHLVDMFSFDEVIPTLRQTSTLEELVIIIIRRMDHSSASPVHLPFLKRLYLPILMPLSLLHTPGLEEFYVRHDHCPADNDLLYIEVLKTTLSGYFKTVRNLRKLAIYSFVMEHALPIIEEAPSNTRELALYGRNISYQLTFAANCPKLHNLKAISIEIRNNEMRSLLEIVKTWAQERQSTTEGGIGPFKNLANFSLDFVRDKNHGILQLKHLKRVFEEEGVNFFSRFITEFEMSSLGVPPFHVL